MKKIIVFLLSLWLVPELSQAQSVTIGSIPPTLCAGDSIAVSFTATGFFGHKNAFTLQLFDATIGGFSNLGSIIDTLPGTFTINTAVPSVANSKHYRFRILAAVPYMVSADNGFDISIGTMPDVEVKYTTSTGFNFLPVVAAGMPAKFTLTQADGDNPIVDSVFWNFGPGATPKTASGGLSESVTYASGGKKTGAVRIVVNTCGSRTIPFSLLVLGCSPQIPHYAIVVDSNMQPMFSSRQTYWVNPGVTLDLHTGNGSDTVFAEPGSVILGGSTSLIYLKAGASYVISGIESTVVADKGSSVSGLSANDFYFGCDNLTFDYTTAPPNAAHPLGVKNELAALLITIVPNPTTGIITIEGAPLNNNLNVSVMNILGETVIELRNNHSSNFTIDLSKLSRGSYYVRLASANTVITKKVVKE